MSDPLRSLLTIVFVANTTLLAAQFDGPPDGGGSGSNFCAGGDPLFINISQSYTCGNSQVSLTASYPGGSSIGAHIRWYDAPSGGTRTGTGSSYTASAGQTVYVAVYSSLYRCESSYREPFTAFDPVVPIPPTPAKTYNCTQMTLTRSAPPAGTVWYWQTSPGGTSTSNSSVSWTVNSVGTYYLRAKKGNCWSSARAVDGLPEVVIPAANGYASTDAVCVSGTATFQASHGDANLTRWYTSSGGGTPFHTGSSYTKNITTTTTYYLEARTPEGCVSTSRKALTVRRDPQTVAGTISSAGSRCGSGGAAFTLSGHTGTIQRWESRYRNGSGSWSGWSLITETDNMTSVTPTLSQWSSGQRTYEIRATVKSGSCTTLYPSRQIVIHPLPTLASGSNVARCGSGAVTLTATPGSHGNTIRWYGASSGGALLHTGTSYTTPNLVTTTRYYAVSYNTSTGCEDSDREGITAVVNAIPDLASGSDAVRCGSGTVTLTATPGSDGTTIRWYNASSGGSLLHTGTNYTTPGLSSSTTYYAASYNVTTGCEDPDRKAITAVVNAIPALASGSDAARCGSGTVTLTANPGSNGSTIRWYGASSGGSLLHTGTSYTTPDLNSSTTYYAASYHSGTGCEDPDRKAITAVVNSIPVLAVGINAARCGSGTVTLTATPGNNGTTIRWYSASSGGTLLYTGTSYTTPSLSSSTTYYAASYNATTGCFDNDRKPITAVVNAIPALASGSNVARCGSGTVTLTATPGSNGNTIRWYSASTGGTLLHTGTSYTTPSLSSSTTYYAASYHSGTGCEDPDRKSITAVINAIPALASGSNVARCGSGTVTLTATPGSNGNTIRWYSASTGGTLLHTGTSYTTPSLSSSTTYYAASYHSGTGCEDPDRTPITAVVNAIPSLASGSNVARCGSGTVTLTATPGSNGNTIRWYSASSGGTLLYVGTSYTTPSLSSSTTYYAASYHSGTGCEDPDRTPITAVINAIPALASGGNVGRCGSGTVTLTATPGSNANTIRWYSASSGGTLLSTGTSYTTPSLSSSTTYYAASYNSSTACIDSDRKPITAVINPIPAVSAGPDLTVYTSTPAFTITGGSPAGGTWSGTHVSANQFNPLQSGVGAFPVTYAYQNGNGCGASDSKVISVISSPLPVASGTSITLGEPVTLTLSGYSNLQWYRDGSSISGATQTTCQVTVAGTYHATFTNSQGVAGTSRSVTITENTTALGNYNYIITHQVKEAGVTDTDAVTGLTEDQQHVTVQYFDGLGRPMQVVGWRASPTRQDVIQPIVYDDFGRNATSYLPYTGGDDGSFRASAIDPETYANSAQYAFYQDAGNDVVDEPYPYAKTIFEPSPLNRVEEQGAPGAAWQPGTNHTAKNNWRTNTANEVMRFRITGDQVTRTNEYYEPNELWVTTTTDEHGNELVEYTDKRGQVVLKAVEADTGHYETCYIYDIYPRLRSVIQPKGVALYRDGTISLSQAIADYGFTYDYDSRGRMISKKVPGADTVFTVYDQWDRQVLTQDGVQRTSNKWTFTSYDVLNRPVITGFITDSRDQATLQTYVMGLTARFVTYDGTGTHGYDNGAYPFTGIGSGDILSVNYYDTYDHLSLTGWPEAFDFTPVAALNVNSGDNLIPAKGQLTGSKTRVLGTDNFLNSVVHYDEKYRAIQATGHNDDGSITRTTSEYDFTGKVLTTKTEHLGGGFTESITERFTYDHADRLLTTTHQLGSEAAVTISALAYNELGQLKEKNLHVEGALSDPLTAEAGTLYGENLQITGHHGESAYVASQSIRLLPGFTFTASEGKSLTVRIGTSAEDTSPVTSLQSLDYRYNIRGWMTKINQPDLTADGSNEYGSQDHFGMQLLYEDAGTAHAQYNGNIGKMAWKTSLDVASQLYAYSYDPLNRLTQADYGTNGSLAPTTFDASYSYDPNGNILSLQRKGLDAADNPVTLDHLTYTYYSGNQLKKVEDSGDSGGFKNGSTDPEEYLYDRNGSMTVDKNKGIDSIRYNYLNLPEAVYRGDTVVLYTYDAAGVKLKKTSIAGGDTTVTRYQGPLVFENDTLQFIQHAEGRIVYSPIEGGPQGRVFEYQYHLKDHLGNVRMTLTSKTESYTYLATLESEMSATEEQLFGNVAAVRQTDVLYDHTHLVHGFGNESARLNVNEGKVVGPTLSLYVNAGDTVKIRSYAKYTGVPGSSSIPFSIASEVNAGFGFTSGGETAGAYAAISSLLGSGSAFLGFSTDPDLPKAYLNYHYFDTDHNYITSGFVQVSAGANGNFEELMLSFTADQQGYVYIYVANETQADFNVFFDDVEVEHAYGPIVAASSYYPFGLTFGEYQRVLSKPNYFKYNGKEEQPETGWLDYGARMYDAELGKWYAVDRMSEKYYSFSPYMYAANNPLIFIDPDGKDLVRIGVPSVGGVKYITVDSKIAAQAYKFAWQMYAQYGAYVTEAYRTDTQQANMKGVGTNLVAKVGKSRHQQGFALDFGVNAAFYRRQGSQATNDQKTEVGEYGVSQGWGWQYELKDYPHFELDPLDYGYSSRDAAYEVNKQFMADMGGEENLPVLDFSSTKDEILGHAQKFSEYWGNKKEEYAFALTVTPDQLMQMGYTPDNYLEYYEQYADMFNIASSEKNRHDAVISAFQ